MIDGPAGRRGFLKAAGAAIAAPLLAPLGGASFKVRIGLIGIGGGGGANLDHCASIPDVEIAALCDSDGPGLARAAARFPGAKATSDYRQVLAAPSIHAVCISAPAASQAGIAIEACAAGKDVWLEPPACLSLEGGERIVRAAQNYRRIVQAGAVRRSDPSLRRVRDMVRRGNLGRIVFCRGAGSPDDGAVFEFVDLVQFIAADSMPISVSVQKSAAGVLANYRYPDFVASYETGAFDESREIEAVFHGTRATLVSGRLGCTVFPCNGGRIDYRAPEGNTARALHWRDFVTCIRTRGKPACGIESYVRTAATCRLSALALRSGTMLDCD